MNKEVIESQWVQIRQLLKEKFSNLTEEDIRQINGHYDELVTKLQQKYGYSKDEAEDRIRNWNFDRFSAASDRSAYGEMNYRGDKAAKDKDGSSIFNWFLALVIPLALVSLLYFNMSKPTDGATTIGTSQERVVNQTPADQTLATNVRNAIIETPGFSAVAQNITATADKGTVTLYGTVPSNDFKVTFENIAKKVPGVTSVVNNIKVE